MGRFLVAGGAGYIGSHTVRALGRRGHDVVVLDDLSSGRADFVGDATLVEGSTLDHDAIDRALTVDGAVDGILHFAASIEVAISVRRPLDFYRNNVTGSLGLIEAAVARDIGAFVFSSTAAVYGDVEVSPIPETAPKAPTSPYGRTKLMVEQVLADAHAAHGLPWMAPRYFNAAGAHPDGGIGEAHDPESHLIPLALAAVAGRRDPLQLFGTDYPTPDGTCVRDYIHVADLADAHVLAVEALLAGRAESGAYNLGTGVGHSNRQVLETVSRVTGLPPNHGEADRRPGDPAELVADATRFRQATGWAPTHSDLDTIVATAWTWHQTQWA